VPHVNTRYYPRAFTDEQTEHLAEAITRDLLIKTPTYASEGQARRALVHATPQRRDR
jgi:hypothetical protein